MSHSYEHRNFMIFNCDELYKIDFSQVLETSVDTIRKSIDKTKTFVKWETDEQPICLQNLATKEGPYTYDQIVEILGTSEWNDQQGVLY